MAQAACLPVSIGTYPEKGPMSLTVPMDFPNLGNNFSSDLFFDNALPTLGYVQCIFIDNSLNAQPFSITFDATQQKITIPANSQGYFPVLTIERTGYKVASTGGVVVPVIFLNTLTPMAVWKTV